MTQYEKSLFIGDIHVPYQDVNAIRIVLDFAKWFKPSHIFIVGDLIDFYSLSHFLKDPKRINSLQDDLDEAQSVLHDLRVVAPRAKITFFEGNHETRLIKYVWSKAAEISCLRNMRLEELLDLERFNIDFVGALEEYRYHDFVIEHGDIVRKFSGYTAKGMMEKRGCSGLSGHTHRLGSNFLTNMGGDYVWFENGCLCERKPEYIKSPNWQLGYSVGYFKKNDQRFTVEQVCIADRKAVYAGKEFA